MRGPGFESAADADDAGPFSLDTPEFLPLCWTDSSTLSTFHVLFSMTHLRVFTGALGAFSAAQGCRRVKVPMNNPQPIGWGDGREISRLLILWWKHLEVCSVWFLRVSPPRLSPSCPQR